MNKKLYLIRSGKTKFGGAENYLFRLSNALKRDKIDHQIINSYLPKFLPSWIRALLFNLQLIFIKKNKFFYSLDRITCADLYRAGDGVHKAFLKIENKSKFNLLHPTYLFLEKKCFINSKSIIANSKMVKEEIIKYCEDRNRPYFFGVNNWNMPVCIFDHMTEPEWEEKMKLEVTKQKKRYFLNPQREVPYGNKLN